MKKKIKVIMFSILIVMAFVLTQIIASFIGSIFISAQFINSALNPEEIQTEIAQTLSNNATIISIFGNIIFLVLGILIYKIKKKKINEEISLNQIYLKDLLIPVIAIVTYSISFNLLINILPIPASLLGNTTELGIASQSNLAFYILAILIIAPIVEEFAFRGIIMTKLRKEYSSIVAIMISAILFGLIHLMTGSILIVLFAIIGGIIFGLSYEKTGTLFVPIIVHSIGNICDMITNSILNLNTSIIYAIIGVFIVIFITSFILLGKKKSKLIKDK